MKKADFIIIATVLIIAGALFAVLYGFASSGDYVTVSVGGTVTQTLPLSEDTEQVIRTEHGNNTLVIRDGKAYITDADCPDKICEKHPKIYRNGESIICLPHQLVISVISDSGDGIDAVAK